MRMEEQEECFFRVMVRKIIQSMQALFAVSTPAV
jgi:hypothetical protein